MREWRRVSLHHPAKYPGEAQGFRMNTPIQTQERYGRAVGNTDTQLEPPIPGAVAEECISVHSPENKSSGKEVLFTPKDRIW